MYLLIVCLLILKIAQLRENKTKVIIAVQINGVHTE